MMMQRIPDEKIVDGFSVFQLNDMIKELSPQVFLFWIRLINVDISEIEKLPQESLIQQSIIRVKHRDLDHQHFFWLFIIITFIFSINLLNGATR